MLLLDDHRLDERRAAAAGPLAPLADSLARELAPLVEREELFIPREKARLTRAGGRCPADGTALDFDPWDPRHHRCPRCGAVYTEEAHYRWWVMSYQLWLAERAVHGALLHLLRGDPRHAALARRILDGYAARYLEYPNRDNVLGPTRPFFSTYLESIWVLQLAVALDLLEAAGAAGALSERVRERVLEPSAALIASYDEGLSNRQTWNDAALAATGILLRDRARVERALLGDSGVVAHLGTALLPDGTWYEGENYHLFAHRALWYGVTLAARAGVGLPASLLARFDEGFATPFVTALPDFTFPSRRDSQYGVSLRQWRFAELAELGLACRDDPRLRAALAEMYDPGPPSGDTGRARSTAEVERNGPPRRLTRADLGWRSLLHALPALPPLERRAPRSALLAGQGLAVLRRDAGRLYAALDYGHSGGGHGHPDRLGLLLVDGATRWLDDMGTGSYVDPSLFWYRSTLAHDAPMPGGRGQPPTDGRLLAWEERGGAGWVDAEATFRDTSHGPATVARRTLVVMPDYAVDVLTWSAPAGVPAPSLPLHVDGELAPPVRWTPAPMAEASTVAGAGSLVRAGERADPPLAAARLEARRDGARLACHVLADAPVEWWRAIAPGPPGAGERRFHLVRGAAASRVAIVWDWRGTVTSAELTPAGAVRVTLDDGTRHEHARAGHGWHVELHAGAAHSSIDLEGLVPQDVPPVAAPGAAPATGLTEPVLPLPRVAPHDAWFADESPAARARYLVRELGADDWRASEEGWREAGAPTATVALQLRGDELVVEVDVRKHDLHFAPARATNELDNEHPDTNSDGVQLYLLPAPGAAADSGDWLLVPEVASAAVRAHPIRPPAPGDAAPRFEWRPLPSGYALRALVPLRAPVAPGTALRLGLVVNEMPPGRERRRGQLVLGGARGEFVYLQGDRLSPDRFITLRVADD